jgi:alpha-glucosidase
MKLLRKGNELLFVYKNREVFIHSEVEPFVCALDARYSFSASRGKIRVTEKIITCVPLSVCNVVKEQEQEICLEFSGGEVTLRAVFTDHNGLLHIGFESPHKKAWEFRLPSCRDEAIFGGGEQFRQLNLKGEIVENMVSEHISIAAVAQRALLGFLPYRAKKHSEIHSYSPMPHFISSKLYSVRFVTDSYGIADFTNNSVMIFRYRTLPREMIYAEEESFSAIAGAFAAEYPNRQYLPDWCLDGMIIGVQGGIDRAAEKAKKMLDAGAKIAGVWCQDWSGRKITSAGKQVYWNWEVDNANYPELAERIRELKQLGVRFLAYINPYLVENGKMYNEFKEEGYLIKNRKGEIYHIKSTTFNAGMMDLTNPGAIVYLKEKIIKKNMLDLGVSGYMADFGEYLPADAVLFDGDPTELHNAWPVMWAKANREAVAEADMESEVMFFTRSGYSGCEQYTPIMWNGDQYTDYSLDYGLPCVMPASFNLGFSGITAAHCDIGGFISFASLARDGELFVRWMELSAFSPLMRSHESIRPENNAQYDSPDVIQHTAALTSIHQKLKPYIESCLEKARKGIPVMAPDFYYASDFSRHKDLYSYFFGDEIFVSPVIKKGLTKKTVYLPDGEWVHFFTKKAYNAGEVIVDAPLGCPPAFYKKNGSFNTLFESII